MSDKVNKPGRPSKPVSQRAVTLTLRMYPEDLKRAELACIRRDLVTPKGKPKIAEYLRQLIRAN